MASGCSTIASASRVERCGVTRPCSMRSTVALPIPALTASCSIVSPAATRAARRSAPTGATVIICGVMRHMLDDGADLRYYRFSPERSYRQLVQGS